MAQHSPNFREELNMTSYTRPVEMYVPVQEVRCGDLINGVSVSAEPSAYSDHQWVIQAGTVEGVAEQKAWIQMILPHDHPVHVRREVPVPDGFCRFCGSRPIKYNRQGLCNTCYAKAYREAKKAPENDHFEAVKSMMPEHARESSEPRIRLVR